MGPDIISELPDCFVAKILSYLQINDSVKTSVLSKRWEFIWLKVSVLDLTVIKLSLRGEALDRLMHGFVKLNRGSCLQNFKIKYGNSYYWKKQREITFSDFFQEIQKIKYYDSSDGNKRVLELIAEVVHRGVQHLDVETEMRQPVIDFIPKYVYVSKTLMSLRLVNVGLENPKFDVSLPNSASPLLEDLTFDFPDSTVPEQIDFWQDLSVSRKQKHIDFSQPFYVLPKPKEIELTIVPRCLISALEYVNISALQSLPKLTEVLEILFLFSGIGRAVANYYPNGLYPILALCSN